MMTRLKKTLLEQNRLLDLHDKVDAGSRLGEGEERLDVEVRVSGG